MPLQPNFLERTAFFTLNLAPGVMLDLAGAMAYQAVSAAMRLRLFEALHDKPRTAAALADSLGLHERGTESLLQALAAIGYLDKKDGQYANSGMTEKWILSTELFDTEATLKFWDEAMRELWSHAPDVVRTGERPYDFYRWVEANDQRSDSFQQTLIGNAKAAGSEILKKLKLPGEMTQMLDIGGGHGMFSILLCQRYPKLQATIIDSNAALETARRQLKKHGLADRIGLVKGDLWEVPWESGADLILLFNLMHHYDQETNVELLQKTSAALKPGGTVAILDQIASDIPGSATNALIRLIALQYYLFADGRVFTHQDMNDILNEAELGDIKFHKLTKSPGTMLVTASKPG